MRHVKDLVKEESNGKYELILKAEGTDQGRQRRLSQVLLSLTEVKFTF